MNVPCKGHSSGHMILSIDHINSLRSFFQFNLTDHSNATMKASLRWLTRCHSQHGPVSWCQYNRKLYRNQEADHLRDFSGIAGQSAKVWPEFLSVWSIRYSPKLKASSSVALARPKDCSWYWRSSQICCRNCNHRRAGSVGWQKSKIVANR